MNDPFELGPIEGVCDVRRLPAAAAEADRPEHFLIEVPHGATESRHYDCLRERLVGDYDDDLKEFFHVNTDVGSSECAMEIARDLAERGHTTLLVRGLVPRTFVDLNRMTEMDAQDYRRIEFTPAVPEYVTHPRDIALLRELHGRYQRVASAAFRRVCGNGGLGLILHTYAPKSVEIHRIDGNIVAALREAYLPANYARWKDRPDVDVISADDAGRPMAPRAVVDAIRAAYDRAGVEVTENGTYRLHPATMGFRHAATYPGQVTCVEINRALLADPFVPFRAVRIGSEKLRRMAGPLASALADGSGAASNKA